MHSTICVFVCLISKKLLCYTTEESRQIMADMGENVENIPPTKTPLAPLEQGLVVLEMSMVNVNCSPGTMMIPYFKVISS